MGTYSCKLRSTCRFLTICLSLDPNKVTTLQLLTIFKSLLICRLQFTSLVFLEMDLVRTLDYWSIESSHSGLGGVAPKYTITNSFALCIPVNWSLNLHIRSAPGEVVFFFTRSLETPGVCHIIILTAVGAQCINLHIHILILKVLM